MRKLVILCVDDERIILTSLMDLLRRQFADQYTIELAESGEEALEILEKLLSEGIEVPVIISDQILPGINGDELFIKIHQLTEQQKLLEKAFEQEQLAREALRKANEELEQRVQQRTTELAQAKEAADAANQAKSAFLSNMSHELRTPLNAVLGFAQLLAHSQNLLPEQQEYLNIIRRSGGQLLMLINQVLDLSKIEAGKMALNEKDFDVYGLLDETLELFRPRAKEKGLQVVFEHNLVVPQYVRTDEVKLRQILINLLNNAIKFTKQGKISLRVFEFNELNELNELKNSRTPELPNSQTPKLPNSQTHKLKFEVEDTGPGIPPDKLPHIFDAFVQLKAGWDVQDGTGLGLPLSQKFVQLMGGDIAIKSVLGCGTTVIVEIPFGPAEVPDIHGISVSHRVVALEPDQPQYHILVADDKWDNRQLLMKMLSAVGFDVREATNGQETVEMWKQWKPHLIWMDIWMPVMNGYEATKRIRNEELGMKNTVIIAVTASSFEDERTVALSAGCDDVLYKPFQDRDVFDLIHRHLAVRFVYAEGEQQKVKGEGQKAEDVLTPSALAALPQELLEGLKYATITTDINKILTLINEIRPYHVALADALMGLANEFAYDKILGFISKEEPHLC